MNDMAFFKLFGEDSSILISFLNAILDRGGKSRIRSCEFLSSEAIPKVNEFLQNTLVVCCRDFQDTEYDIGIQTIRVPNFVKEYKGYTLFDWSNQYQEPEMQFALKPAVYLTIVNEDVFSDRLEPIQCYQRPNCTHVFIELSKFKKTIGELASAQDQWLYFLKNTGGNLPGITASAGKEMRRAYEKVRVSNWSPGEKDLYVKVNIANDEKFYMQLEGFQKGVVAGYAEALQGLHQNI